MKKYIKFYLWQMCSWLLVSRKRLAKVEADLLEIESQLGTSGTNVIYLHYRFFNLVSSIWGFTKVSSFDFIEKVAHVAERDLRKAEFKMNKASQRLDEILQLQNRVEEKGYRNRRHWFLIYREVHNRWNIFALKAKRKEKIERFSRELNLRRQALSSHLVLLCNEGELVFNYQEKALYPATF